MKNVIVIVLLVVYTSAKPEHYKEKEDFQYSRSSTDEEPKAGFYAAQRGNMGGNYERAHNMDSTAQGQMSSLVRQVDGEMGDAIGARKGHVHSAASTQGIYGHGNFDLSNLSGRNFQENSYSDGSLSHTATSENLGYGEFDSSRNSQHSSNLQTKGFGRYNHNQNSQHSSNLQSATNLHNRNQYEYGREYGSIYNSQSDYSRSKDSDHESAAHESLGDNYYANSRQNGYNRQSPVKIMLTPGRKVIMPITAQAHLQNIESRNYQSVDANDRYIKTDDYNSANPNAKHYESSYKYNKEWEKHDTQPVAAPLAIPTISPYINIQQKNREMYDQQETTRAKDQYINENRDHTFNSRASDSLDYEANQRDSHIGHVSRIQNAGMHSESHNNRHHGFTSESQNEQSNLSAYRNSGIHRNMALNNNANLETLSNQGTSSPKQYESSYSYHKSWERQGDPYVIQPAVGHDGQTLQKLTDSINNEHGTNILHKYDSRQYQERLNQYRSTSHNSDIDCEEEKLHARKSRSLNSEKDNEKQVSNIGNHHRVNIHMSDNLEQQSQNLWGNLDELGSRENYEITGDNYYGQQIQSPWGKVEDLGQETQSEWEKIHNINQQVDMSSLVLQNFAGDDKNKQTKIQEELSQLPDVTRKLHNTDTEDLGQQSYNDWSQVSNYNENSFSHLDDKYVPPGTNAIQTENSERPNPIDSTNIIKKLEHQPEKLEQADKQNLSAPGSKWYPDNNQAQETYHTWGNTENYSQQTLFNIYRNVPHQEAESNEETAVGTTFDQGKYTQKDKQNRNLNTDQKEQFTRHHNVDNRPNSESSHSNTVQSYSLQNLWDRIENLQQQLSSHNYDTFHTISSAKETNTSEKTNKFNNFEYLNEQNNYDKSVNTATVTLLTNDNNSKPETDAHEETPDIGRGDIGPEENSIYKFITSTNHPIVDIYKTSQGKNLKKLEEIDSLALVKESNETAHLHKNDSNQSNQLAYTTHNLLRAKSDQTTSKILHASNNFDQQVEEKSQTFENVDQQFKNVDQQFENVDQQFENVDQQFENVDQQFENVDQPFENVDEKFVNLYQQFENTDQQFENTDQQFENTEQQFENVDQQSSFDWNQQHEQNLQLTDVKLSPDLNQQTESFWDKHPSKLIQNQKHKQQPGIDDEIRSDRFQGQNIQSSGQTQMNHKKDSGFDKSEFIVPTKIANENFYFNINAEETTNASILGTVPKETTEEPGFWKSIGNKLTNAKDKVKSWFQNS